MSASPMARQAVESKAIPIKRVVFNDLAELPDHYSSTPGGTLFSTTPGGSKIIYEKSVLLNLRNSPISKTPPTFEIPENILNSSSKKMNHPHKNGLSNKPRRPSKPEVTHSTTEDQFQIDL